MSIFGSTPGQGSGGNSGSTGTSSPSLYGRGDLQAAFNWLVNQPEHIRKQASDPDRLMTLYYRSTGRPEMIRTESARIEVEAPVSGQNFISDLRQINEAMRQFDGPSQATIHTQQSTSPIAPPGAHTSKAVPPPARSSSPVNSAPNSSSNSGFVMPIYPPPPISQSLAASIAAQINPPPSAYPDYAAAAAAQNHLAQTHAATHAAAPQMTANSLMALSAQARTQAMVTEVREKLNLSSDAEALNVLVTMGYRHLKPLLG